jgi:hypothetical protein
VAKTIHTASTSKNSAAFLKTGVTGQQIKSQVLKTAAKQISTQVRENDESGAVRTAVQATQSGAAVIKTATFVNDTAVNSTLSTAKFVSDVTNSVSEWKSSANVNTSVNNSTNVVTSPGTNDNATAPPQAQQKKKYVLIDRENGAAYAKKHYKVSKILKGEHDIFGIQNAKNPNQKQYLKVATLKTAKIGAKTLKTTAVIGATGLLKTAVVTQKGFSVAGNALSKSEDANVRVMGHAAHGAEYAIGAGKTAVQLSGKTLKTAYKGTRAAARGINSFAAGIKANGVKRTLFNVAKTGVTNFAAAASKIAKEIATGFLKKTVIPLLIVVVVIVAAAQAAVTPIIAAAVNTSRVFPFDTFFEWVVNAFTGEPEYVEQSANPEDVIRMYMEAEAYIAQMDNSKIALLFAGANASQYATADGVIDPSRRGEFLQKSNAYQNDKLSYEQSVNAGQANYNVTNPDGTVSSKSVSEPPAFDKSPYFVPPTQKNESGEYVTDGGAPNVAAKYMGARWSPKTDRSSDIPTGENDALQKEMLAALVANKMKLEAEGEPYTDWTKEEVKQFYNSLPLWTMSVETVCEFCEGCETYSYTYSYEVTKTLPGGGTSKSTETRTVTVQFCPGHIWDEINIQTDEDPDNTIAGDAFNMNRVFTKLNFTDEDKKLYQDTLNQIYLELLF